MVNKNAVIIGLGAALLVISTSAATLFINGRTRPQPAPKVVMHNNTSAPRQEAAAKQRCDDGNVAGKVIGGIGGGVVGSLMGGGVGKTATTIGGALVGAYAGGQAIPTQNATCPH